MRFIEVISRKKFTLLSIFLFLYVFINLVGGERGLISYYKNIKIKEQLIQKKENLQLKLTQIEKKNNLLTNNLDLDYLETIYREKFLLGKKTEKIYINN